MVHHIIYYRQKLPLIKERKHYLLHRKTIDKFKPPLHIMNVFAKTHVLIKEPIKVAHLRTNKLYLARISTRNKMKFI